MAASNAIARPWLFAVVIVVLLAAHGLGFYALRHLKLSAALVSLVAVLVALKHLGLLSSTYKMFRRRT